MENKEWKTRLAHSDSVNPDQTCARIVCSTINEMINEYTDKMESSGERDCHMAVSSCAVRPAYRESLMTRIGNAKGEFIVPAEFDSWDEEIEALFDCDESDAQCESSLRD